MKITIVAGARPNFVKIAPIMDAIRERNIKLNCISYRLIHTGQHFDYLMSHSFFSQLNIPQPDANLDCMSGTHAIQTADIMVKFENELLVNRPDVVLVVGDVTSTMACAISAKKLNIDVVHVEAGIRSGDMNMPEEINRVITDSICNHFFTTTILASNNLKMLNIPNDRIHMVGNTMIDSLYKQLNSAICPSFFKDFSIKEKDYFLLTLHRPSNVDNKDYLLSILETIHQSVDNKIVFFPVHPRTRKILQGFNNFYSNIILVEPQPYLEFLFLLKNCKAIITDSGGISEESTVLNIPCLTLRNSTERPETIELGTNELIGDDFKKLHHCLHVINENKWKTTNIPSLWDGHTAKRIVEILCNVYN